MQNNDWYKLKNTSDVISPSLLVYPDRISKNIGTMISMAGGTSKLRPHVKTHKTAEIINMQLAAGISKFKCATIAEAELLALCGAPDILLAMQPVGANMNRFFKLMETFTNCKFSALVDNELVLNKFVQMAKEKKTTVALWMDINNGMNRTGIIPDEKAVDLFSSMNAQTEIKPQGLHVYDGHLRNTSSQERSRDCDTAFKMITELKNKIETREIMVKGIVAGGSPTFPFHAKRAEVDASPGTTLLWDAGYGGLFPEMEFLPAAVLISRVISKPDSKTICLDLGHKSLASEMPFPRVRFLNLRDCKQIGQSEEHFVLECEHSANYEIGDVVYAVPMHICPTVAKYEKLQVVENGQITKTWKVAARNQSITI